MIQMSETQASGPEGFYVSVADSCANDGSRTRHGLLLGPYATKADAESDVSTGRRLAQQVNDRAIWYAYGTCRVVMQPGAALPKGKLNEYAAQAAKEMI
jgi:hypothetical protein